VGRQRLSARLKGEQIPLEACIFAVVDVWDALRSNRPYRPTWPIERVVQHIRAASGSHFDPRVVEAFLICITRVRLGAPTPKALL
jgi:HD-GYP domain-containing protein (c-di-GMP phosphodiesterase class II)